MKENPTLRLLHQRASLRVYDKRDISQETLDQILQAMMRAPTAGNQMLYSVIVVRDDATKAEARTKLRPSGVHCNCTGAADFFGGPPEVV